MDIRILLEQNPWWENKKEIERDFHLEQLKKQNFKFEFPVEKKIHLSKKGIYILRGPRQIGKTTLLKKLIKTLLKKESQDLIFYFSFDIGGITSPGEIKEILLTYFKEREPKKRAWIFLDEVTIIKDWALGIKALFDLGFLKNATFIITGSSSLDIKKGGERLPGRRGLGFEANLEMRPLSFSEIASQILHLNLKRERKITLFSLYQQAMTLLKKEKKLKDLWQMYLFSGGFPQALNNFLEKRRIKEETYFTFYEAILNDWQKANKNEGYLKELAFSFFEKNFEPLNWNVLASATTIGSHNTVYDYVETMNNLFLTETVYQLKFLAHSNLRVSFKKNKKIYFQDPLIFHLLRSFSLSSINFWGNSQDLIKENPSKLIETCILRSLRERFAEIHFWRNNFEIDFIASQERKAALFVEVKYQKNIVSEDYKNLKKLKGGLLVTKETLDFLREKNILLLPAHLCLL